MRAMRFLGLLLVGLACTVSGCGHKSDPNAPQVEQGGTVQTAARAWALEMPAFERDLFDALAAHAALTSEMVGTSNQQVSPAQVAAVGARFHELYLRARLLPNGTSEIDKVNSALEQGLALIDRAYDDYQAGLEQGRPKLLQEGDGLIVRAQAELAKAEPAMEQVVGRPPEGTIVAEALKIQTAARAANGELIEAFHINHALLLALKRADLKQATKLAAQAKHHVDQGLARLEALPRSDYDQLQAYLQDMIGGYQLVSDGFDSYVKGIPQLDLTALRKGDEQIKAGYKKINNAAQTFFVFLRSQ